MLSLPSVCQVCGRWPAQAVCSDCLRRFAPDVHRCPCCAREMPGASTLCGECLRRPAPHPVGRCITAVDYRYPWDHLIARFKFRGEPGWADTFAAPMWLAAKQHGLPNADTLWVPVPVRPQRLAMRGYNQAWELCRALQRLSDLPGLSNALVRLGDAPDQHLLTQARRQTNLQGAFAAHPAHVARLRNASVVLVDDVRTTGATLEHAALALRQAGCQKVDALVFARTPCDADQTPACQDARNIHMRL